MRTVAKRFGIKLSHIKTEDEAKLARTLLLGANRGIILLESEFTRGLDLKFIVSPYVIAVANLG